MTDLSRKKRITAQDIALLAGVSRSAVSRAFTEGAYIDPEKRALVLQAAEELGYRPNALAAGLQGGQSNLVAIFAGQMPNEYDKEVMAKLVIGLNSIGKWPIVIGGTETAARKAVSEVLRYPLESMILRSGSLDDDIVQSCGKLGIPVISSGRVLALRGVDNICCRNQEGMAQGTRLLLDRGRRRFGTIGGPAAFASSKARRLGVAQTLHSAGLEILAEELGEFTVQSGYQAAHRLLAVCQIDALVCANDAMAIGALSALREKGLEVPGAVSVIGFDDIAMAAWPAFSLTTLRNPVDALVTAVVDLLERRAIDPDMPDETIHLDAALVLRGSH
ncbi:MAG: LacI family DNA-binding transcriptional regulator [Cypionkella sp.]